MRLKISLRKINNKKYKHPITNALTEIQAKLAREKEKKKTEPFWSKRGICALLKSNWLFHVNPFTPPRKRECCNEFPHDSGKWIWKGQAKKPTTRLFDLCLYLQIVIGVEHSNSDSFTLLVN